MGRESEKKKKRRNEWNNQVFVRKEKNLLLVWVFCFHMSPRYSGKISFGSVIDEWRQTEWGIDLSGLMYYSTGVIWYRLRCFFFPPPPSHEFYLNPQNSIKRSKDLFKIKPVEIHWAQLNDHRLPRSHELIDHRCCVPSIAPPHDVLVMSLSKDIQMATHTYLLISIRCSLWLRREPRIWFSYILITLGALAHFGITSIIYIDSL